MKYDLVCYMFILALFGHWLGDFVLQPKSWALKKSQAGPEGFAVCTLHVLVYTFCLMLFWRSINPLLAAAIFVPHWLIDRYSLANKWAKLIRGRTFEAAHRSEDRFREFDIAFTCLVYKETDGAFHLFCLWLAILYFYG